MRSYLPFGFIILAQFLCAKVYTQSLSDYVTSKKNDLYFTSTFPFSNTINNNDDFSNHPVNSLTVLGHFPFQGTCKKTPLLFGFNDELDTTNTKRSTILTSALQEKTKLVEDQNETSHTNTNSQSISLNSKVIIPFHGGIKRVVNAKCHGTSTGYMKGRARGGIRPYHFEWSNGSTSNEITNLPAGVYTLTISDAGGNVITETATLNEPSPIEVDVVSYAPTCGSANDGQAIFYAKGGSPFPYKNSIFTTLWSNTHSNGFMFDLSTKTKISLTNISIHLPGTHLQTISIYLKTGKMNAAEFDSTQWQLISSTQIYGAGLDEETPITFSIPPILNSGDYSLYIYNHHGQINGITSTVIGKTLNYDHIVTLYEGISRNFNALPFQSGITGLMNMSGKISYVVNSDYGFKYNNNMADGQWFQQQFSSGPNEVIVTDALGCASSKTFITPLADSIKLTTTLIRAPRCFNTNDGEINIQATPANNEYHSMTALPFTNPAHGSMIHFSTSNNLILKGIDLFLNKSGSVAIYVMQGDYLGNENNSSAWTGLGTYSLTKVNNSLTSLLTLNNPYLCTTGAWSLYIYSTDNIFKQLDSSSFYDNHFLTYHHSNSRLGNTGAFLTAAKTGSYWTGNIIYGDLQFNLQYHWSNQSSNNHLTNLTGGNYQCTIQQDNGCSLVENFSIPRPAPIIANATIYSEIDNEQNGSATLQMQGGTPPYYIQWLNSGIIGNHINQLSEGPQPYFVSDARGCTLNDTLNILRTISPPVGHGLLSIAPNPGHGFLHITKEVHGMEDCLLNIYDFTGRLLYSANTKISILMQGGLDMSQYSNGNYFINVRDEDQVFQAKANIAR